MKLPIFPLHPPFAYPRQECNILHVCSAAGDDSQHHVGRPGGSVFQDCPSVCMPIQMRRKGATMDGRWHTSMDRAGGGLQATVRGGRSGTNKLHTAHRVAGCGQLKTTVVDYQRLSATLQSLCIQPRRVGFLLLRHVHLFFIMALSSDVDEVCTCSSGLSWSILVSLSRRSIL